MSVEVISHARHLEFELARLPSQSVRNRMLGSCNPSIQLPSHKSGPSSQVSPIGEDCCAPRFSLHSKSGRPAASFEVEPYISAQRKQRAKLLAPIYARQKYKSKPSLNLPRGCGMVLSNSRASGPSSSMKARSSGAYPDSPDLACRLVSNENRRRLLKGLCWIWVSRGEQGPSVFRCPVSDHEASLRPFPSEPISLVRLFD